MNDNPYAVLDKQVGYREALEAVVLVGSYNADVALRKTVAIMFNTTPELIGRDLERLRTNQCIACGGEKTIRKDHWNPLNGQWDPYYIDCQECEE